MSDVLELQYGALSTMPSTVTNGKFSVTTDTQQAFIDIAGARIPLKDFVTGNTENQIKAIQAANALPKMYLASDTFKLFYYSNGWQTVSDTVQYAEKDLSGNTITTTYATKTELAAVAADVAAINSFEIRLIPAGESLPVTGQEHVLYFVPSNPIETQPDRNEYIEYMWVITTPASTDPETGDPIPAVGKYEIIGTTELDLTNYYTKSEVDTIESGVYSAIGVTKSQADAANYVDIATRIGTLDAELGALDPTVSGYTTVASRLTSLESADAEINAKLGAMAASTSTDFQTVEQRLTALESDTSDGDAIAEINAKLGNMAASTTTGFQSVEARLQATEANDAELAAKLGNMAASTSTGFQSVEARLQATEANDAELAAKLGAMAASTSTGFQTVEQRLQTTEANDAELAAKLGAMAASTSTGFQTVEQRLQTTEANDAELAAKLGNMAASTSTGFQSVEARLSAEETSTSRFDAELGTLDSTAIGYQTVAQRLTAGENADAEFAAQLGAYPASTDVGFVSVAGRFTADEADITEIKAQIGASYPTSTSSGFKSIDTRLTEIASAVGNINKFEIRIVESLPATTAGESYVLYFVPVAQGADQNNGHTKYIEYMWIKTSTDPAPKDGYYEEIGITEADLSEYYTSAQVDAIIGTDDVTSGTLRYRIKGNETAIAEINAKLGNMAASTTTGFQSVEARLSAEESATSRIDAELGTLDSTATGYQTVAQRLTAEENATAEFAAQMGNYKASTDTGFVSVEGRFTADEADITEIIAKLGAMADSTSTGFQTVEQRLSAIEGGAVTQSENQDNSEKPILVSGSNHDTVEYVPGVTVNADNNGITAELVTLGAAKLIYNPASGALEVNFENNDLGR